MTKNALNIISDMKDGLKKSWTLIFATYVNPSRDSKERRRRARDSAKGHIKWADSPKHIRPTEVTSPRMPRLMLITPPMTMITTTGHFLREKGKMHLNMQKSCCSLKKKIWSQTWS
jgi:hypothetical protein